MKNIIPNYDSFYPLDARDNRLLLEMVPSIFKGAKVKSIIDISVPIGDCAGLSVRQVDHYTSMIFWYAGK
jgi:hypothetical protein